MQGFALVHGGGMPQQAASKTALGFCSVDISSKPNVACNNNAFIVCGPINVDWDNYGLISTAVDRIGHVLLVELHYLPRLLAEFCKRSGNYYIDWGLPGDTNGN